MSLTNEKQLQIIEEESHNGVSSHSESQIVQKKDKADDEEEENIEKNVKIDNCLIEKQNKRLRCHKLLYFLYMLITLFYSLVNAYTRYQIEYFHN